MEEVEHDKRDRARKDKAMEQAIGILRDAGFDSAMVLGSWSTENGLTAALVRGLGNWYAQNGLIEEIREKRRVKTGREAIDEYLERRGEGE